MGVVVVRFEAVRGPAEGGGLVMARPVAAQKLAGRINGVCAGRDGVAIAELLAGKCWW